MLPSSSSFQSLFWCFKVDPFSHQKIIFVLGVNLDVRSFLRYCFLILLLTLGEFNWIFTYLFKHQPHKMVKHTICRHQLANRLSVFDRFVGLALKGLMLEAKFGENRLVKLVKVSPKTLPKFAWSFKTLPIYSHLLKNISWRHVSRAE